MSSIIKLSAPSTGEYWEIPVLFEDDHLLALDKPACLLSCPDRYDPARPNLMKLLQKDIERGAGWAKERQLSYLSNAHRLDFETSGIMLLAKDKPSLIELANQFSTDKPHKTYVALVYGVPEEAAFRVDAKIMPHAFRIGEMRVDSDRGKKSITDFKLREAFKGYSLLECLPITGRTHQIRVHLRHVRLRLVADKIYGGPPLYLSEIKPDYRQKTEREERPLMGRCALHAEQLIIPHPLTRQEIHITAPWPKDFTVAVKYLRKFIN